MFSNFNIRYNAEGVLKGKAIGLFIGLTLAVIAIVLTNYFINADDTAQLRNPGYYNDLIEKINDAYNSGVDINSINNEYDCDILLYTDAEYSSKFNDYDYKNSLTVEFNPSGEYCLGWIRFELSSKEFNDMLLAEQRRMVKAGVITLLIAYGCIGLVFIPFYCLYKGAGLFEIGDIVINPVQEFLEKRPDNREDKERDKARRLKCKNEHTHFFKWLFVCLSKVVLLSFIVSGITLWVVKKGNISINKVSLGATIVLTVIVGGLIYLAYVGRRMSISREKPLSYINEVQDLHYDNYEFTDKDKKSIVLLMISSIALGTMVGLFVESGLSLMWFWACFEIMVALVCIWNYYMATYSYLEPIVHWPGGRENWPFMIPLIIIVFVDFVFHGFRGVGLVTWLALLIFFVVAFGISPMYESWKSKEENGCYKRKRDYSVALSELLICLAPFLLFVWVYVRYKTR